MIFKRFLRRFKKKRCLFCLEERYINNRVEGNTPYPYLMECAACYNAIYHVGFWFLGNSHFVIPGGSDLDTIKLILYGPERITPYVII